MLHPTPAPPSDALLALRAHTAAGASEEALPDDCRGQLERAMRLGVASTVVVGVEFCCSRGVVVATVSWDFLLVEATERVCWWHNVLVEEFLGGCTC